MKLLELMKTPNIQLICPISNQVHNWEVTTRSLIIHARFMPYRIKNTEVNLDDTGIQIFRDYDGNPINIRFQQVITLTNKDFLISE